MKLQTILEVFLYEIVELIPMVILALTPFRDRIRFSIRKTVLIFLLLFFSLSFCKMLAIANYSLASLLSTFWIFFYLITYKLCVRSSLSQLLFVLLLILNYGSFIAIVYSYMKAYFFPQLTRYPYSWSSSLIIFLVMLVSYPIVFFLMEKKIRPLIELPSNTAIWRMLWIVPGTFCLCFYYNLYTYGGIISFSSELRNVLFGIFLTMGAIFITYIAVLLVQETNKSTLLKSENYQLSLQKLQFEFLQHKMEEARHAQHDIRQIMTVLQAYISDGDIEGLQEYILQYIKELPSDSTIVYCEHYVLNALLLYYKNLAAKNNISYKVKMKTIDFSDFSDSELTILFGNLLENAIEACIRQNSSLRFIHVYVRSISNKIIIRIDNSYEGTLKRTRDGIYPSSKGERIGIGMFSIQKIVKQHGGIIDFFPEKHTFSVTILFFRK